MENTQNKLGHNLPEQSHPTPESFKTDSRSLEKWLNDLPMASIGELARQVFHALKEVNRLRVPDQDRMRTTDCLRPVIQYVQTNLERQLVDAPAPLRGKTKRIAHLCRELETELALAYKIVVINHARSSGQGKNQTVLRNALHRAIRHTGRVLLYSYVAYEPVPEGTWSDLHALYHTAETAQLTATQVTDEYCSSRKNSTIGERYSQTLLIATASPYSLRPRQTLQLMETLESLSSYADVSVISPQDTSSGTYHVELSADQPPVFARKDSDTTSSTRRALKTEQMLQKVAASENGASLEQALHSPQGVPETVLRQWGSPPDRVMPRNPNKTNFRVTVGLAATHSFVAYTQQANGHGISADTRKALEIVEARPVQHSWAESVPEEEKVTNTSGTVDYNPDDAEFQGVLPVTQLCSAVNESSGGYCLVSGAEDPVRARVGDLIGMQEENDDSQVSVAIVRWIRRCSPTETAFGVQILAPDARAIALSQSEASSYPVNGLLLPEIEVLDTPATVILPPNTCQVGDTVFFHDRQQQTSVELTELDECSYGMSQFRYNHVASSAQPVRDLAKEKIELESVWAELG